MPGISLNRSIVGGLAGLCAIFVANPASAQQDVTGVVDKAQEAAKETASQFLETMQQDPWTWVHLIAAAVVLVALVGAGVLRRSSLSSGRDVSSHPGVVWLACGAMVLAMSWLGGGLVAGMMGVKAPAEGPTSVGSAGFSIRDQAIVGLCGYGLAIVAALVFRRILALSAPKAGLELRGDGVFKGLLAAALAWPVVQAAAIISTWVVVRLGGDTPDSIAHSTLQTLVDERSNPWAIVLAGLAIIGAPIVEEFVFRVGLQSAVLRVTGRPWLAILFTATAFSLIHLGDPKTAQWPSMIALGVLGVCLGFAYERTRSLVVPVVLHGVFNAVNVALALVGHAGR